MDFPLGFCFVCLMSLPSSLYRRLHTSRNKTDGFWFFSGRKRKGTTNGHTDTKKCRKKERKHLSVRPSVHLPACLPVCLSVCLPACMHACLSLCLSVLSLKVYLEVKWSILVKRVKIRSINDLFVTHSLPSVLKP